MGEWKPKDPEECFALKFDFSSEMVMITGATITITMKKGEDTPENILDGILQIDGAVVKQRVKDGIDNAKYSFRCVATDGEETWVIVQDLPVKIKK